jgi:aspartate/methionine/tyrosine aminotransferase
MADDGYYPRLRETVDGKRLYTSGVLSDLGFKIYDSGSAFYLWARIPEQYNDAIAFNEMLMRDAGVGMTPGSAFADGDDWDAHVRICIAREDSVLEGAMEKLKGVLA